MSLDETLLDMVMEVSTKPLEEILLPSFDLNQKILNIMHRWAGSDQLDPGSRGLYFDARDLGFLEALTTERYQQRGIPNPLRNAVGYLEEAFEEARSYILTGIISQSFAHEEIFNESISYNLAGDVITSTNTINFDALESAFITLDLIHTSGAVIAWKHILQVIDRVIGIDALTELEFNTLDYMVARTGIMHMGIANVLARNYVVFGGTTGDDILLGDIGRDTIYGEAGNDTIYGGQSDDRLHSLIKHR